MSADRDLIDLAHRVGRLTVDRRDPEKFFEDRSELKHQLLKLAHAPADRANLRPQTEETQMSDFRNRLNVTMESAARSAVATMNAIEAAKAEVQPHVPGVKLAQDSAAGVYKAGLLALGHGEKVRGVHPAAMQAIFRALTRSSVAGVGGSAPRMAADSKTLESFAERYPNAAKTRVL